MNQMLIPAQWNNFFCLLYDTIVVLCLFDALVDVTCNHFNFQLGFIVCIYIYIDRIFNPISITVNGQNGKFGIAHFEKLRTKIRFAKTPLLTKK